MMVVIFRIALPNKAKINEKNEVHFGNHNNKKGKISKMIIQLIILLYCLSNELSLLLHLYYTIFISYLKVKISKINKKFFLTKM